MTRTEQQHALLAHRNDPRAVQALLSSVADLATHMVRKFVRSHRGLTQTDAEDLYAEAMAAVAIKAIPRWSPEGGSQFSAYAAMWMRGAFQHWWRRHSSVVRPEARMLTKAKRATRLASVDPASLHAAVLDAIDNSARIISLDARKDDTDPYDVLLGTVYTESGMEIVIDDRRRGALLAKALTRLPAREQEVLASRTNGETLEEIGKRMKVTRERVRQIETKALGDIRKILARSEAASLATKQAVLSRPHTQ